VTHGRRPAGPTTQLADLARIYVDGNNLLHRRRGGGSSGGASGAASGGGIEGGQPTGTAIRLLLAGMRAALPDYLEVVLMLDGQPDPGAPTRERIRHGLEVRHAGRWDADSVLVEMVSARPFADRARTLVVTDDRGLIERVRHAGGRTERLDWLEHLLRAAEAGSPPPTDRRGGRGGPGPASPGMPRGASISQGRPPRPRPDPGASSHPQGDQAAKEAGDPDAGRAPWRPGRGATRKRGNPKRGRPPA
jgi:hypothetical protein